MARGTSPEPSYIRDLSRQWVLPSAATFGCSFGLLLSRCSLEDRIIPDWPQQSSPEKTKTLHVFHSDRDWHATGLFYWPMWIADGKLYSIPSFSRETPCQKLIDCKQAQTSCCLETLLQAQHQVTRHHVYGSVPESESCYDLYDWRLGPQFLAFAAVVDQ